MPPKKGKIDFSIIFSLFILGIAPLGTFLWFFIPVAVSLILSARVKFFRFAPFVFFVLTVGSFADYQIAVTELDIVSLVLFFLLGWVLYELRKRNASYINSCFKMLGLGAAVAVVAMSASAVYHSEWTYGSWAENQLRSEIFPYFFRPDAWPEESVGIYKSVLFPVIEASVIAWFGCMISITFFINGVLEGFFGRMSIKNYKRSAKIWKDFSQWRASDKVLIFLVVGMGLAALSYLVPNLLFARIGWNFTVLALFPVFMQGVALCSFLIPRVSFLVLIFVFVLLLLSPIPVLVLAGLSDLWFDFRSKMKSDPKSKDSDFME